MRRAPVLKRSASFEARSARSPCRTPEAGIAIFILLAVIGLALGRVVRNPFVFYDDPDYVVLNPLVRGGLTLAGIGAAAKAVCVGNWHPLTTLSHMLDVQLFGLDPAGHHLTSLVMHTLSAVLLMLVLARATGQLGRSAMVAALFGVHPLHVESVAWVAERKDVLCGLFWVLTIWFYLLYVARPARIRYAVVGCLFTLALSAKSMAVTLPFTLLLIDFWPLQRMTSERDDQPVRLGAILLEKLPLLALSIAAAAIAIYTQRTAGMMASLQRLSLSGRISNAIVTYTMYLLKVIWPRDLAVFYPLPAAWPLWEVLACAAVLLAISLCAILLVRRIPYLLMGWLWYLVTLVPVIGLVQVGDQSMADRYTYIPLIGIFISVCWSAGDIMKRFPGLRPISDTAAVAAVVSCVVLTWRQISFWSNSELLFRHALAVTQDNYVAENNLANVLQRNGRRQEAEQHYLAAVRIRPTTAVTQNNLANLLAEQGELNLAADHYRAAIAAAHNFAEAHYNFGVILRRQGRLDAAIEHFRAGVKSKPDAPELQQALASALAERQLQRADSDAPGLGWPSGTRVIGRPRLCASAVAVPPAMPPSLRRQRRTVCRIEAFPGGGTCGASWRIRARPGTPCFPQSSTAFDRGLAARLLIDVGTAARPGKCGVGAWRRAPSCP